MVLGSVSSGGMIGDLPQHWSAYIRFHKMQFSWKVSVETHRSASLQWRLQVDGANEQWIIVREESSCGGSCKWKRNIGHRKSSAGWDLYHGTAVHHGQIQLQEINLVDEQSLTTVFRCYSTVIQLITGTSYLLEKLSEIGII